MDIVSNKKLSKNIKNIRQKTGLSQAKIAKKAKIPLSTYLKIESGYTPNPSIQNIVNIAEALNTKIESLIK